MHASLQVEDIAVFKEIADQPIRKLIHSIQKAEVLDKHTALKIQRIAKKLKIAVSLQDGKIVVPDNKADIKILLRFLDDGIFEASLSKKRYQTNSKRPFAAD